MNLKQC